MMKPLLIGTRGSPLAMWQARWVARALHQATGAQAELKVITARGDRLPEADASPVASKGLFTTELERALLSGQIDLAVHSLKDLPVDSPPGLVLAAVPLREDPADVLISPHDSLKHLPPGSVVLCGSPRRRAQVLARRGDLEVQPVRGNIQTRLMRFDESHAAGMILARAGLVRLGLEGRIRDRLDPADFLPAPGQAALAVQCRTDDRDSRASAEMIDDARAHAATACERAVLAGLGGGCRMPVGAYARFDSSGASLLVTALAAAPDGSTVVKDSVQAPCRDASAARELGLKLAEQLRASGADQILRRLSSPSPPRSQEVP